MACATRHFARGVGRGAPPRPARRRCRPADTPRMHADPAVERLQLRVDAAAAHLGDQLLDEGVAASRPPSCWYFLLIGDSSQATSCFSSSSLIFASRTAPIVDGASLTARSRTQRVGLLDVLLDLGLDRLADRLALFGRRSAAAAPGRPPASSARPAARRRRARRSRCSRCCSVRSFCTSSFLAGRAACAGAVLRRAASAEGQREPISRRDQAVLLGGGSSLAVAAASATAASTSASFSTMRCRPVSLAPSSSAISVTPWVARPELADLGDAGAHQHAAGR